MPPIPNEQTPPAALDPALVDGAAPPADASGAAGDAAPVDGAAPADADGDAGATGGDPVDQAAEAGADDASAEVAPYEGLVAPEGTTLDPADMALATPLMRGLGIADGEPAQAFIDGVTPILAQITTRLETRFAEDMATRQAEQTRVWGEELRADPEIGGSRFEASMAASAQFRDKFFDADTVEFLNVTGLGNYPGLARGFAKAAAAFQDDSVHGLNHQPAPGKPGDNLYDAAYSPKKP